MNLATSHLVIADVIKALNLQGRTIRRVVLDFTIGDAVRVYVEEFATEDGVRGVADALGGTEVTYVDAPPEMGERLL